VKVLIVFGTRPEAIKLCPLVLHLSTVRSAFEVKVCVTGQHREMLDNVLSLFGVRPDYDLNVMATNQSLSSLTARIIKSIEPILDSEKPDVVVVQGDTTTTFASALAAFYQHIPVGHVEAGLRTGDRQQPFPEEVNRVLTTQLSDLHFAPTAKAAANLRREGIPSESIMITGNTGIDALLLTCGKLESGEWRRPGGWQPTPGKKLVLVTAHRRESFGDGMKNICTAIRKLASRDDAEILFPVHPNPSVRAEAEKSLSGVAGVHLVRALDYLSFVDAMRRSAVILTDSGGIQEEAPSLGKPVLVLRERTERQEAIDAGTARLVGTDASRIVRETADILDSRARPKPPASAANPFGDGRACERIARFLVAHSRSSGCTAAIPSCPNSKTELAGSIAD
jgi:UDP-N-acetylglucosamine 2-epimerase (non-hydrolysing)